VNKRDFLAGAAAIGSVLPLPAAAQPARGYRGPVLLTVTGEITRTNRGPMDKVLDQMMAKQKLSFDKAHVFDFAALVALPSVAIRPTLEYDSKHHLLRGPKLSTILEACGAKGSKLAMRAIDGYSPIISVEEAHRYNFIVATHLDKHPMPLGGFGPLWAIYEADRFPEMTAKPVDQRFANCPWGLFHIDVQD
jgi:hypothetical protein